MLLRLLKPPETSVEPVASPREKGRLELSPSRCTRGQPQRAADGFAYRNEAAPRDLLLQRPDIQLNNPALRE